MEQGHEIERTLNTLNFNERLATVYVVKYISIPFLKLTVTFLNLYFLFCRNKDRLLKSADWLACSYFISLIYNINLSYDLAVIQWITSCHKNRMTTCVITLWRTNVTSLTTSVSTMRFPLEILSILKAIKSHF